MKYAQGRKNALFLYQNDVTVRARFGTRLSVVGPVFPEVPIPVPFRVRLA